MLRDARVCARVIRNVIVGFLHRCQEAKILNWTKGRRRRRRRRRGKSGEKKVHGVNRERVISR